MYNRTFLVCAAAAVKYVAPVASSSDFTNDGLDIGCRVVFYSMICVMIAVPTVLPPSRTVNRWPLSTARGWRSSHLSSTLSPGMTILLSLSSVASGQKRPQGSSIAGCQRDRV